MNLKNIKKKYLVVFIKIKKCYLYLYLFFLIIVYNNKLNFELLYNMKFIYLIIIVYYIKFLFIILYNITEWNISKQLIVTFNTN